MKKFTLVDGQLLRLTLTTIGFSMLIFSLTLSTGNAFNDDNRGVVKWNPYYFSNSRYSDPGSYYGGMSSSSRGSSGLPKRLGERSSMYGPNQIYKWSPVYFSDRGLFGRSGGYGSRYLNSAGSNGFDSYNK